MKPFVGQKHINMKQENSLKIKLSRIFCSIFFLYICVFSAQKYTIKYVDAETKLPIVNLKVSADNGYEGHTDSNGVVNFNNSIGFVTTKTVEYREEKTELIFEGYYTIEMFQPKTILIEEVMIKKPKVLYYGSFIPKKNKGYLSSSIHTKNLKAINEIELDKSGILNSFNFDIASKEKYNIPFHFIIYESVNGKPSKELFKQLVVDYNEGMNVLSYSKENLRLEKGKYFIGMEWVFPSNEETFREIHKDDNGNPIIIFGQQLAISKNTIKKGLKSYTFKNGKLYTFNNMYSQGISILTKE